MKKHFQMYYDGYLYASYGNEIVRRKVTDSAWEKYLRIRDLSVLNYSDLYNRALRHGVHNFYKISREIDAVVLRKRILFYKDRKFLHKLNNDRGSKPLRNGVAFYSDKIVYGEYFNNGGYPATKERAPVNLYMYDFLNDKLSVLYTFKNIKHIHFVQPSIKNNNILYIGTGDLDSESAIFRFDLRTGNIEKMGGGSQTWRAVSIIQMDDYLFWGMDSPDEEAYIVKYDLKSGVLEKLEKLPGPVHYSTMNKRGEMFVATAVEDRTKHTAAIYRSIDGGKNWVEYKRFKKDIFHEVYFGFGKIEFINNQEQLDELYYNLIGLKD